MNATVWTYLCYLLISIGLTVWVARTLFKHGQPFLENAFGGDERLARSINQLLVVGFYLINLGYITLNLQISADVFDTQNAIEHLSLKIGFVLLVLGGMHFFNLYVFNRIRRKKSRASAPPPVLPTTHLRSMSTGHCDTGSEPPPATAA